jgi:hypothetical protein
MKRSFRWYVAWGIMVASLSMLLFMATAGPAQAWTQEENQFNSTGSGSGWCSGQDGKDSSHPCLYWQEAHYTSITLIFFMDPSLRSSQSRGYDFPTAIQNAFTQYTKVPAWNPYMTECFSVCSPLAGDYFMGNDLPCLTYGHTWYAYGNTEYGYNSVRGGNEYYAFFGNTTTEFNDTVIWDNNNDWSGLCGNNTVHGDGIATALHESGHVIGLGHTGDQPAIMDSDHISQANDQLTTNSDIPAIEAIYPGNQQSS